MTLDTIKLLEENVGRTLFDINCSNLFFGFVSYSNGNKSKNKLMDLIKLKQNKKITYGMGENICK